MEIGDLAEVLIACKHGDREAWSMIIRHYSKPVFNIALNFIGDRDLAADITQDVFIKVYSHLDQFKDDRNFSAWLFTVCRNYCIDYWRKNKKHIMTQETDDSLAAPIATPEGEAIKRSEQQLLRRLLMRIDPEMRVFLICRDVLHLSYQQIAEKFAIPEGTVKSRINRARLKLSQLYLQDTRTNGLQ